VKEEKSSGRTILGGDFDRGGLKLTKNLETQTLQKLRFLEAKKRRSTNWKKKEKRGEKISCEETLGGNQ